MTSCHNTARTTLPATCRTIGYTFILPLLLHIMEPPHAKRDYMPSDAITARGSARMISSDDVSRFVPPRSADSRKGENGKVLVVGGSYLYHGAPILSSLAALRCGADLVYTAVPKPNVDATRAASADLIVIPTADPKLTHGSATKLLGMIPTGLHSAAIGMGLAVHERGALVRLLKSLTDMDMRLSLDASALIPDILSTISDTNTIVTPHAQEFRRLFGVDAPPPSEPGRRIDTVYECAAAHCITILLKGQTDIISDGNITYLCNAGTSGMTVGGTGDILSGLTAAMLATNRNPVEAAAAAAYVNGTAGEILHDCLGYSMIASDLLDTIPTIMKRITRSREEDRMQ